MGSKGGWLQNKRKGLVSIETVVSSRWGWSHYHCKKILKLTLALVSSHRANLIFDNSLNTKFPCLQHFVRLIFGGTVAMMIKYKQPSRG